MNIKHENVPGQVQEVVFEINKEDYAANVEAALKRQRRTANVPGFRPGNAPMGMVKKMYGQTILVNEVDKLVNENMQKFIEENKIKSIFEPMPVEEKSTVDFENPDNFVFAYEYALAPEVNLDYAKVPAVVDFKMIPGAEERDNYVKQLRERHGNYIMPETIEENDSITVKYSDDKEGFFFMHDLTDEAKKKFVGKKNGESIMLSLRKAFANEAALARFMKMDAKDLDAEADYKFKVTIDRIGRIALAEMNEDFFKKVYPDGSVTTEAQFNEAVDKVIVEQYQPELDRQFMNDAIEALLDNTNIELPEAFMRRYILAVQKDMTEEMLNERFNDYKRSFQWQILEAKVVEGEDVVVKADDVKNYFREYFLKNYFGNFEMDDEMKERVESLVTEGMKNRENVKAVYDMLYDTKLTTLLRSKMNIEHKEGDSKAFIEMLTSRQAEIAGTEAPAKKAKAKKATKKENE